MKRMALLFIVLLPSLVVAQGMSPADEAAFTSRLESWAKTYYPAIESDSRSQKDLLLGFLVDEQNRVLKHSVAIQTPPPVAVADELKRMFPERGRAELMNNGAACILRANKSEKKFCVVYAAVTK